MSGTKQDRGKPDLSLVPRELVEGAARAYMFGVEKYARYNFTGGISHARLLAGVLRHLVSYMWGEKTDPESGLSHLDHAAAGLGMLAWMAAHRPDLDDLYRAGENNAHTPSV